MGWLNEPLYRIRFFQVMERLIQATTGLVPREDDIGKAAALALVERAGRDEQPRTKAHAPPLP